MTNAELAKAYGITLAAVSKWTPEKRANAKSEIAAGCCPIIKKLIGELASECYLTQHVTGKFCSPVFFVDDFRIRTADDMSPNDMAMTVENLQLVIQNVKGLRKC